MSFLLKLYKYREREKINQLENYCTEALAYCLQHDNKLMQSFLKIIDSNINSSQKFDVETQKHFTNFDWCFDIVLISDNALIFIECKVESKEGDNQLSKYADTLLDLFPKKEKYLIYLTKYSDNKERTFPKKVTFKNIRYSDLCSKIEKNYHDYFSIELKDFIQGTIMKTIKSVSIKDIEAMKNIKNVLESYDGFLNDYKERLKKIYEKHNLTFKKSNLVETWIEQDFSNYSYTTFNLEDNKAGLWFGIFLKDNVVVTCVECDIYNSSESKKIKKFKKELMAKNATEYGDIFRNENFEGYYFNKDLQEFAGKNVNELHNWYDQHFKIIFDCIKLSGLKISQTE